MNLDHVFIGIGCVLLTGGIVAYGFRAIQGEGHLGLTFALTMTSLLFFNLPTFLAKQKIKRKAKENSVTQSQDHES